MGSKVRGVMVVLAVGAACFVGGCTSSHERGGDGGAGERCGPVTCGPGTECCNASCGICVSPGGSCSAIACSDGGPPVTCSDGSCGPGLHCCTGCRGEGYCVPAHEMCSWLGCPVVPDGGSPGPCGSTTCVSGEQCCLGCTPEDGICVPADSMCPVFDCPPSAVCGGLGGAPCGPGEICDYPDGSYCGGDDSTGVCIPQPTSCPEPACRPVCGCDGNTYCSACEAHVAGTDVQEEGACPGSCDPMDAAGVGTCGMWFGFTWDGSDCTGVSGCDCAGADCGGLYPTLDACTSARRSCFHDCRTTGCPSGETCSLCWASYACLPPGVAC